MPRPKTIAFFGATGGCTLNCLIPALQAGYRCNALVRSPPKLHALLHQHDVTVPTANLAVIQGSIDDADAVRRTLIVASASAPDTPNSSPDGDGELVDFIVSGVGGTPRFDNPLRPTLDNPTICQDAVRAVLDACRGLQSQGLAGAGSGTGSGSGSTGGNHTAAPSQRKKPFLIVVSTTGIASKRDIPIAMIPLYHWMLKVPHDDKRVMEEVIRGEMRREPEGERALSGYTILRPSLLTSGEGVGAGKIRFGVDDDAAVGYTISRKDVGAWMFERLVEGKGEFEGRVVSLTA
ncbi:hypothetical protein P170DRAFT_437987 [Aspergillus steynii IBT 23096]|uniref:NAD(P)-binding domain-containing protein n=1 Tax=Aspergillus steynii IBT 23096 TaxID=1392250 RepID=A0A2I2G616_9EURO|nr:uncharacterized protein P170DRAFT_437987 [Aspergillus steynii IBT 23096]PLB48321.1 hypothetical protein P170DRAFT_437987 [Aspergillus steynii IBT 23096]